MECTLAAIFGGLQRRLFPALREELGALTDLDQRFVQVVSVLRLEPVLAPYQWAGVGRPPVARPALAMSFIAKAVYNFPTTRHLLDALRTRPTLRRLCGYEGRGAIPDEATFSRAFADFAAGELPQQLHAMLVTEHVAPRLIGHVSRDATAIEAAFYPRGEKLCPESLANRCCSLRLLTSPPETLLSSRDLGYTALLKLGFASGSPV